MHEFRGSVIRFTFLAALSTGLFLSAEVRAEDRSEQLSKQLDLLQRNLAINGEFVHNAGDLQMNITNWGFIGSLPMSQFPMSASPSAQWPAGSGIEYLYAAGIWIGAQLNGVPVVSTGYPETEFYPPKGPLYTVYRSREGDTRGAHYPEFPDDDQDGRVDEDWLNGFDDDHDGLIDEDFAAIGQQMFTCWYTDDQEMASIIWPEHTPMHIGIRQETYQWGEEGFDDFVAVQYFISNIGNDFLTNVYVGIYADLDAGPLSSGSYFRDDKIGYTMDIRCVPYGDSEIPIRVKVLYVYDDNGDEGRTPGYFGISLIDYPVYIVIVAKTPPFKLPSRHYAYPSAIRIFRGLQSFDSGGEPTNDYERYKVLSNWQWDENTTIPNDYKALMSMGPFSLAPFDEPLPLNIAYAAGFGLDGMLQNAAAASLHFRGTWVDHDGLPTTGILGRETPVKGPADRWWPDACNYPDLVVSIPAKEFCWSNLDCSWEKWEFTYSGCYHSPFARFDKYQTGVYGKEHEVNWIAGSAPPPPNMRLISGDGEITILWDNYSETVPDPLTRRDDFEGYQIWRADDWHRPLGTSVLTGPTIDLWNMVETRDIVNGIKPDVDFKMPFSEGGWIYEPLQNLEHRDQLLGMYENSLLLYPLDSIPCPPGLTANICDTLERMARHKLGFEGGTMYYKYVDNGVKNGLPYFYSVTAYDLAYYRNDPIGPGRAGLPTSNFIYVEARSGAQDVDGFEERDIYVVPNTVTTENMEPWRLGPTDQDPSGLKCEFRNLPKCRCTVRIYTVSGDLVQTLDFDGRNGVGTLAWDLLSRNGQDVASGVYLYSIEPDDGRFSRVVGKFVVIR